MKWHKLICSHKWAIESRAVEGATLGWGGQITRQYGWNYICEKCSKTKYEGGFVIPGDRKMHPESYTSHGWPLDESGSKLEIVDG